MLNAAQPWKILTMASNYDYEILKQLFCITVSIFIIGVRNSAFINWNRIDFRIASLFLKSQF